MPIRPRNPSENDTNLKPTAPAAKAVPVTRRRRRDPEIEDPPALHRSKESKRTGPNWNEDGTYKIGDCRPPPGRRFQPGQSGNPKGRPKSKPSMDEIIIRTMEKNIVMTNSRGATTKTTHVGALILKIYEKAVKGDLKASLELLDRYDGAKARSSNVERSNDELSAAELAMLGNLLQDLGLDVPGNDNAEDDQREGEPA